MKLVKQKHIYDILEEDHTEFDSSPPAKNGRQFAHDVFRCTFVTENFVFWLQFHWSFFPMGLIDNNPALVQIMALRRIDDKPLFEPMLAGLTDAYVQH